MPQYSCGSSSVGATRFDENGDSIVLADSVRSLVPVLTENRKVSEIARRWSLQVAEVRDRTWIHCPPKEVYVCACWRRLTMTGTERKKVASGAMLPRKGRWGSSTQIDTNKLSFLSLSLKVSLVSARIYRTDKRCIHYFTSK